MASKKKFVDPNDPASCTGVPMLKLYMSLERCTAGERGMKLSTPQAIADFVREHLGCSAREHFMAIYLGPRNNVLGVQEVSIGGIDQAQVDPRVLFAGAVSVGASGMIICHNHPSGDATPSQMDISLTRQLVDGGRLLLVKVVDHLIITRDTYTSMMMQGMMPGMGR